MFENTNNASMREAGWLASIKMHSRFPFYVSSIEGELILTDNELFMLWFSKILLDSRTELC